MSKLNLLTQNSKIKKSGSSSVLVYNFGIPAFQSKTEVPKGTRKGLSLVSEPIGKSKPHIPWDQITLSKERINEIVLEVIAEFNANNKVK